MAKRNLKRAVSALVALVMVLSILPSAVFARSAGNDGSPEMNEAYANRESLMPIGPSFNVDTLLEWTPESDPDAAYSRASIKLADRVGGFVVNPAANPEAKLMLCAPADSNHDHTGAQGSENFLSWSFNYWQYTDSFVYWSSSEEGLLSVPTGEFIDAAHTNGVPVAAILSFPWASSDSDLLEIQKFLQKAADGSFPVADKMIQLMDYYGFDGYFFSQESSCTDAESDLFAEMMRYLHQKRPDMIIGWRDGMTEYGAYSPQSAVNDKNRMFLEYGENNVVPADNFFMDYHWDDLLGGESRIDMTVETMNRIGRSPYDAFAGVSLQKEGMNSEFFDDLLVDADGRLRLSMAIYGPNSTLRQSANGENFHKIEQEFYTNKAGDPRANSVDLTTGEWAGMSRFFADKTPITGLPFVTDFNSGHGRGYYVNGQLSREREWSYQSLQDVMPTWTWIIDSVGTDSNLTGSYEFDTVYNGGSSIAFEGSLTDPTGRHNVMLYSTDILLEAGNTLELVSKLEQGSPAVSVVLYLDDGTATDYETCEKALLSAASGNEWTEDSWNLDAFAGKTLRAIGLEMDANGNAVDAFKLILGHLAILDKVRPETAAPKEVRLEDIRYPDAYRAEARLSFSTVNGASAYRISQVMADGTEQVIMDTPNNYFYIPTLTREAGEAGVTLRVAGINRNGVVSSGSTELYIPWKYQDGDTDDNTPQDFTNLCLNAKVIGVSAEQPREPAAKAIDGTSEDNSKWCGPGDSGWMLIDLGEPKTVNRWRVEHAEYGGELAVMNTRDFDLQYFDEASDSYKVACEIRGNTQAVTDVILDAPVTAQRWKLNITDADSFDFPAIRIYEWQMFSADRLPSPINVPMERVHCVNNPGPADLFTMTGAPAGLLGRVYRNGVQLAEGTISQEGTLELTFDLGTAEAGKVQYCLVGEDGQESPKLCAEFFAEGGASEKAQEVSFELYRQPGSKTAYSFDGSEVYTTMTVSGLAQGDIVRAYENGADAAATRQSAPVAAGASSAFISGIPVATAGDTLLISVQRAGLAESEKYEVTSPAFPGAAATVQIFAYNNKGESLTGVQFELVRNGVTEAQTSTTSDSGARVEVPLGTYTIRCTGVPAGYTLPENEIEKDVNIEGWIYPVTVQIEGEAAVVPDPDNPAVDPEVAAAVQAAKEAAEAAKTAAEEAQAKAEAAQAAAEAAAASTAADKTAAEAAQAKAEEAKAQAEAAQLAAQAAQSAAEDAAVAADESNKAAAEEARKAAEAAAKTAKDAADAAESARQAAAAQEAAQAAQAAAEAAAAVAEQAQKDAEAAQKAAEEAANSSAANKDAAEKAKEEAAAAQEAAENAQSAAEDAKTAAETAKAAAEDENEAAAQAAAAAAASAKEAADYYQKITEAKAEMAQYLEDTQKAKEEAEKSKEAAEKAQLSCARYYALFTLSKYVDKEDYRAAEQKLLTAAIDDGIEAINAAATVAEVEAALADAQAAIDAIPTAAEMAMPFTDVKEGDWFEYAVNYVYRSNLFKGVSATEFGPRHSMTRAQMITVLYRLAGEPEVEGTPSFKDVKADAYYADAVLWGVQESIVTGTAADAFSPNDPVTRAQAAVFLYRCTEAEPVEEDHLADFADVKDIPAYAVDALNWAVANEILTGAQSGETLVLAAGRIINRAEAAALFMRLSE